MSQKNNNHTKQSGFHIEKLVLLESRFVRLHNVRFDKARIKRDINVSISVKVEENTIFVQEQVDYVQKFDEVEEVNCTIVMVGVFKKVGDTALADLKQFGEVNGAAIIFPYIREHLSSLSLKAGLEPIVLPPANFASPLKHPPVEKVQP